MATTYQLAELLTDAARLANVPPFTASTNVTTTQANYWLAQSVRGLSARLRQAFGPDADYLRQTFVTTQPGIGFVSLPQDAGEVHAVMWAETPSSYRLLRDGKIDALEDLQEGEPRGWPPVYRLEGETIALYPGHPEAQTLVVFYTGHLQVQTGVDHIATRLDGDRWITLDVAIRVLQSQGRDAAALNQERMVLEAQMTSPARRRQPNKTVTIRDVRGDRGRAWQERWRAR